MSPENNLTDKIHQNSIPLVDNSFTFHCHAGVSCYTDCCRKLELYLYPYDIIRLKSKLKLDSAEFLRRYIRVAEGSHPFFPAIMLLMQDNKEHTCPFLAPDGCSVYKDRPSACRTYPLERAVEKSDVESGICAHYFLTRHNYCKGHHENKSFSVPQWERDQMLYEFNHQNDLWAEMDAFFATNPWSGEGAAGPKQQLAFMVCYNIDDFRVYCSQKRLVESFRIDKEQRRRIKRDDSALLEFGFNWLLYIFGERRTLVLR